MRMSLGSSTFVIFAVWDPCPLPLGYVCGWMQAQPPSLSRSRLSGGGIWERTHIFGASSLSSLEVISCGPALGSPVTSLLELRDPGRQPVCSLVICRNTEGAITTTSFRKWLSQVSTQTPQGVFTLPPVLCSISSPCWDLTLGLSLNAPGHHLSLGMLACPISLRSYPIT